MTKEWTEIRVKALLEDWSKGFDVREGKDKTPVVLKTTGPCDGCGEPIKNGDMCWLHQIQDHGVVIHNVRYHAGCEPVSYLPGHELLPDQPL